MTKPDEVTISDATLDLIEEEFAKRGYLLSRKQLKATADVFAVVLAACVPDVMPERGAFAGHFEYGERAGHNALRAAVLRGPS